jgi:hypothetical protein
MSVSELRKAIRDRDKERQNCDKHYTELQGKYEAIKAECRLLQGRQALSGNFSPNTIAIRHESVAMEYGVRIHLDELEALYETAVTDSAPSQHEKELRVNSVALAVSAAYARIETLYSRLAADFPDIMPVQPDQYIPLMDDERAALKNSVVMIDLAFYEKKGKRDAERRVDQIAKGPGRPAGSKNKKTGH